MRYSKYGTNSSNVTFRSRTLESARAICSSIIACTFCGGTPLKNPRRTSTMYSSCASRTPSPLASPARNAASAWA